MNSGCIVEPVFLTSRVPHAHKKNGRGHKAITKKLCQEAMHKKIVCMNLAYPYIVLDPKNPKGPPIKIKIQLNIMH